MTYRVNEIFKSMQGEGANLGKEVIFIRLSGCNLKCPWCDTNHEPHRVLTEQEIVKQVKEYRCRSIVFTGGEPTIQPINPLLETLQSYWIGIETNGTSPMTERNGFYRRYVDYVACSPKKGVPMVTEAPDEIRLVNDALTVEDCLAYDLLPIKHRFISVLEVNGYFNLMETVRLLAVVNERSKHTWLLNQQIHKMLKIR